MSRTASTRFASLSRLFAGAGLITLADTGAGKPGEEDEGGEGEGEGEEGDGAPAPEGEEGGEGEGGQEGGEGSGEEGGEGEGGEEAGDADAAPAANKGSADYKAGCLDTNKRWAGIIINPACAANMELAVSLMLDTDFSAEKIGRLCSLQGGGDPAALALLDKTKKIDVGADASAEGGNGPSKGGEDSPRKRATARVNAANSKGKPDADDSKLSARQRAAARANANK